ncbi:hypothetical protein PYCCODRAFT_1331754, partial [Trametes coccinea BRFM310]
NVTPALDDVLRLLNEGLVPIVVYDGTSLHVLPSGETPYVAISHVWSQGMGSVTEDGLPACLVKRIATLVQRLLPGRAAAFWMDSLCIPKIRDSRKRAIMLMSQTYRDAAKVLVIDDCIRTMCSASKPWPVNVAMIATSAWSRRIWTLQEGVLATELYFEFVEGPELFSQRNLGDTAFPELSFLFPLLYLHAPREDGQDASLAIARQVPLSGVVQLLQGRNTSKAEDELIAISSLLPPNIDLQGLLAVEGGQYCVVEARMKVFLLQLHHVPVRLPFGDAPRLTIPGFRWAPSTLAKEDPHYCVNDRTGVCTEEGLVAEYLCASFENAVRI